MKPRYIIELYQDEKNEWRFRIKHRNGRIVADSAEGYKRKFNCRRNADHLKAYMYDSEIKEQK